MVNRVPVRMTLPAPVANGGTVSVDYPAGSAQVDFIGGNALAQGRVVLNDNDVLPEPSHVSFAYGANSVVVTNTTGVTWPAGTPLLIVLVGGPAAPAGGASVEQVVAALADAVGEGNVPTVEGGVFVGLPLVEGVQATAWDLLTGQADGLVDQGAALKAWMEAQRAGETIVGGVATFDWPEDGEEWERARSGYVRWVVGSSDHDGGAVSWAVAERPEEIAEVDQVLTLLLEFENDSGAPLTLQPAAPAEGRESGAWADGYENPVIADGETARIHVNVYAGGVVAHVEIVGA